MPVLVRRATLADLRAMAGIAQAKAPLTAQDLADLMNANSAYSAWFLAEDAVGVLFGFQHIAAAESQPDLCEIATFLRPGPVPLTVGTRLFEASAEAARLLGYAWINARIGADNAPAQTYYQSRGFRIWDRGADHLSMRFDLD